MVSFEYCRAAEEINWVCVFNEKLRRVEWDKNDFTARKVLKSLCQNLQKKEILFKNISNGTLYNAHETLHSLKDSPIVTKSLIRKHSCQSCPTFLRNSKEGTCNIQKNARTEFHFHSTLNRPRSHYTLNFMSMKHHDTIHTWCRCIKSLMHQTDHKWTTVLTTLLITSQTEKR